MESVPSGFVTVTGRTNVGKSTLMNTLVGTKISITTDRPGTTRHKIRGILDRPDSQLVFLDGPGIHKPENDLGNHLVERAQETWGDGDVVLFLFDAASGWGGGDEYVAERLRTLDVPVVLVPNKIDRIDREAEQVQSDRGDGEAWDACVPVSALEGTNTDQLLEVVTELLPEGPRLFPGENPTDRSRRFRISEVVREKAMQATHDEVPHSLAVVVDDIYPGDDPKITVVEATIFVERDSQQGILIGKGGNRIREVGSEARNELAAFFDDNLYLDLTVRVMANWTGDRKKIRKLERRKSRIGE